MDKVRLYWDRDGRTLSVWFSDPAIEHVCEETGDEVVIVKDKSGRVIGFEKLNFALPDADQNMSDLPLEVMVA